MFKKIPKAFPIFIIMLVGLIVVTGVAFSQDEDQPDDPNPVEGLLANLAPRLFLPVVQSSYFITGRVTDSVGQPVSDVAIIAENGETTYTDADGNYRLSILTRGVHSLAAAKEGYIFWPAVIDVNVPSGKASTDFTALTACTEAIVNGSFETETAWTTFNTPFPADYSSLIAHTGSWSMRTGIPDAVDNVYSWSSANQQMTLPAGAASITLRLWVYRISDYVKAEQLAPKPKGTRVAEFGPPREAVAEGDAQYVFVLDSAGDLLQTLMWDLQNNQQWVELPFDLTAYSGRTIQIHIGTYNDGFSAASAMFVDDVSIQVCDAASATSTPTATPSGAVCSDLISNNGFETTGSWDIPITVYPANYTTAAFYAGARSMRTGITDPTDVEFSYSDAGQWVTIPKGVPLATLKMWTNGGSNDFKESAPPKPTTPTFGAAPLDWDAQYVLVIFQDFSFDVLYWDLNNSRTWTYREFDMTPYAGMTVKVQFGTFNDTAGISWMYVDEVYLDACTSLGPTSTPTASLTPTITPLPTLTPTPTATPTITLTPPPATPTNTPPPTAIPSATPAGCEEILDNTSFETLTDWQIPITEFSAGFSTAQAHTGFWSMRTGITSLAHNRFSYSDAYQVVTVPWDADSATLRFWVYPSTGVTGVLSVPPTREGTLFGSSPLAGDVQYFLILDQWGNWIDTLYWDLRNDRAWLQYTFDLDNYIGDTIRLQFGTYNDGFGGITSMYVDDVNFQICR
jgi:hypothetical protein